MRPAAHKGEMLEKRISAIVKNRSAKVVHAEKLTFQHRAVHFSVSFVFVVGQTNEIENHYQRMATS